MLLKELIGHHGPVQILQNALVNNRLAHGYLFTGPKGIGKTTAARALAQAYLCDQGKTLGDACGECPSCRRFSGGNHPDFRVIEPQGSSLKIDQIRELVQRVYLKAYLGPGRVYLLTDVDKMTIEAANSFLKVLEEPPENTLFLLVSAQPYNLLPTVISRCQVLQFYPLTEGNLTEIVLSRGAAGADKAVLAAVLARGIPAKALEYAESNDLTALRGSVHKLAARLLEGNPLSAFETAETLDKQKEGLAETLDLLAMWYRDILVWQSTGAPELLGNADLLEQIQAIGERMSPAKLQQNLAALTQVQTYLHSNVNARLALENLFLDLLGG